MAINIGSSSINSIYVGDTAVKSVYLGYNLVYSKQSEPVIEIDDTYNYFVFDTSKVSDSTTVTLPKYRAGDTTEWDGYTDWGDGTVNTESYHRYSENGIYTVKTKYVINNGLDSSINTQDMLIKCLNINKNITVYRDLFKCCRNLTYVNIAYLDTSNVTDMSYIFYECSSLTSLDLSSWNTSNVTDMYCMFCYCSNLTYLNLSNWNMDNVTDMYKMLYGCIKLTIDHITMIGCNEATKTKIQEALSAE